MRHKIIRAQGGFTLLELLISIALLAVIVVIIGGAMSLGFRSAESGQKKIEVLERFRTSLNIIESQLQSAYIIKQTGLSIDDNFRQFRGDRSSMQFRSLYSLLGSSKGPVMVTYSVKEDAAGRRAVYGSESSVVLTESSREIRLLDNATDIYFEYFDKAPTDEKGQWANEWTSKDSLPDKIRMTIDKDGRIFSLIIPIRAGMQNRQITRPGPK
jgi:general secretion pathway protein J